MKIDEDQVGTGDMAPAFNKIAPKKKFRGKPCFDLEEEGEYNSFCTGVKTFHRWKKHTKSEEIRRWARENKGKDFYITHNGSYTLVSRGKKAKRMNEGISAHLETKPAVFFDAMRLGQEYDIIDDESIGNAKFSNLKKNLKKNPGQNDWHLVKTKQKGSYTVFVWANDENSIAIKIEADQRRDQILSIKRVRTVNI
jgi:hypothetical protein